MTRPTAEEVLGLYEEYSQLCGAVNKGDGIQSGSRPAVDAAFAKYIVAHAEWKNAQGPVTREWFVERFGSDGVRTRTGLWLECSKNGDVLFDRDVINPTRYDIETLVRLLGGEA